MKTPFKCHTPPLSRRLQCVSWFRKLRSAMLHLLFLYKRYVVIGEQETLYNEERGDLYVLAYIVGIKKAFQPSGLA
jgi:hypothetical protein